MSALRLFVVECNLIFLASNFLVWTNTKEAVYTKTAAGLMTCYEAGLPFYRNSLLATLVFLPVVLVAFNWINEGKKEVKLA